MEGGNPDRRLVSVVIPAFNAGKSIGSCLSSVLAQTFRDIEVVVVDDGSTDGTDRAVGALADHRVRCHVVPHRGVSSARNTGAALARGRYLVFLDSDDEVHPQWLSTLIELLSSETVPIALCGGQSVDALGRVRWQRRPTPALGREDLLHHILPGHFAVERAIFDEVGGYEESLAFGENTELGLRLLFAVPEPPVGVVPDVLVTRRWHDRRDAYRPGRIASAALVVDRHPWVRHRAPKLWASYHSILGVEAARDGAVSTARKHFAAALFAQPRNARAVARALVCLAPPMARRVWQPRGPLRVAIVCPGAGRVRRGYETFALGLAAALQQETGIEVRLMQGGRTTAAWQDRVPCLARDSLITRAIARLIRLRPTSVEHYSFALASLPRLVAYRPAVVVVSERVLGNALSASRRLPFLRFAVVLRNGGSARPPFSRFDLVQHVLPEHYHRALAAGEPANRHRLVPEGFDIPVRWQPPSDEERSRLRTTLDLPTDRPVVLSVGIIDRTVKRMDHVVREVSLLTALPEPPFLLMLGDEGQETHSVRALADELLGDRNYQCRSVPPEQMPEYYRAADVFALASTVEGFGRVYVEALAQGHRPIVHDSPRTRFVLGVDGDFIDMEEPGQLAKRIAEVLSFLGESDDASRRHRAAFERFSWANLRRDYVELMRFAAELA
jgi:1,2-diacylglycerol 3-alpha-glucosyltransferase